MIVHSSFLKLLLLLPIVANHAEDNGGIPVQKTSNELETTTTKSNAANSELECFDLYGKTKCEELRDGWKFCKYANKNLMNEMCRKTCGLCKLKSDCTNSKYKCCEDGITTKTDAQGSNCPGCKDKHSGLCQKYAKDCNDLGWAGLWMHANCKRTCQYCNDGKRLPANHVFATKRPACSDDKAQEDNCPSWKQYGMCDIHAALMKEHCAKTCGFCDLEENGEAQQKVRNAAAKEGTSTGQ